MQSARPLRERALVLAQLLVVAVAVVSISPALVHAQDKRAAVLDFEGPRAAKLRDSVERSLGDEITVVPTREVESTASRLGADLSEADGRVAVARELEIDAWIEGRVDKAGRNWVLVLSVASGRSGESAEVAELTAKDPNSLAAKAKRAYSELSSAIAQSERPEEEAAKPVVDEQRDEEDDESEGVAEQSEDDDAPQDDVDDSQLPMALAIELGAGSFSRDFEYRENLSSLPVYDIAGPPLAFVGLQWFPGAHVTDEWFAHIGLKARAQIAFGLSSSLESGSGEEFSTSSTMIEIGLRGRLPLDSLELGADISYGSHTYQIDNAGDFDPGVPSASYGYLKFHVDATLALGESASIGLGFGLMPLLGLGEVETWFPNAGGLAMEGDINFAYELFSSFDLIASIGARRYAVTIDPTVQDVNDNRPIAAGFVDQYIAGQLGLRFRLGGTP